jgi:RHH-type rel operon transcriptional repressor/antitoxin RelB
MVYKYTNLKGVKIMKQMAVRLPDEIYDRLKSLADKTGRSATYYLREALQEYMDDLEDIYLAEKRLEDIRAGKSRTYTLEEVEQELGLED